MITNEGLARLRIVVGADDAGIDYKDALAEQLRADPRVSEVIDVGVQKGEHTPYPDVATAAAIRIADGEADRGLLVCGTGLGMAIAANKTPGIRAVTAHDPYSVARTRANPQPGNMQTLHLAMQGAGRQSGHPPDLADVETLVWVQQEQREDTAAVGPEEDLDQLRRGRSCFCSHIENTCSLFENGLASASHARLRTLPPSHGCAALLVLPA